MNKMTFAFDEERAKADGVEPTSLWKEIDDWMEELTVPKHVTYKKCVEADKSITYVGIGNSATWWGIFADLYINGSFSDLMARYLTKWVWEYFVDDDESNQENVLNHLLETNDIYQRVRRI